VSWHLRGYVALLAAVCAAAVAFAVSAHRDAHAADQAQAAALAAARRSSLAHAADRRAVARFNALAGRYAAVVREAQQQQQRIAAQIAQTRALHRQVIIGQPVVQYVTVSSPVTHG
jgi:hypothetical protein